MEEANENQFNSNGETNSVPEKRMSVWKIVGITLLVVFIIILLVAGYAYYFIINPSFVSKPVVEKPALGNLNPAINKPVNNVTNNTQNPDNRNNQNESNEVIVKPEHILYLLNEIGAYKLHSTFNGEVPAIEFILEDTNTDYYFTVENNNIVNKNGLIKYDLILEADQQTIIEIYAATDTKQAIMEHYNSGKMEVEMVADTQTLALKGYSGLAQYFGITGMSILW
jgi:hypothetical protein